MASDPKLKELMTKIERLCAEYDAGAFVSLTSKTHGEFRLIPPKDSGFIEVPGGVSVGKLTDVAQVEATLDFAFSISETAGGVAKYMDETIAKIKTRFHVEHDPLKEFTPHRRGD